MLSLLVLTLAAEPGDFATAARRSLLFDRPVERGGFHFQVAFGVGGGTANEGLFHAMEVGGTFDNGMTFALLHTFVQNKGVLGPERGPDLLGGWMLELKVPLFVPDLDLKIAAGLGGLHDQSDGIRLIPGFGWSYGVDLHLILLPSSGLTVGLQVVQVAVESGHHWAAATSLGYTFF
jgi:hypothetical protein